MSLGLKHCGAPSCDAEKDHLFRLGCPSCDAAGTCAFVGGDVFLWVCANAYDCKIEVLFSQDYIYLSCLIATNMS